MTSFLGILKNLQDNPTEVSFTDQQVLTQQVTAKDTNQFVTKDLGQSFYDARQCSIEYIPFKRKIIEFEKHIYKERVPKIRRQKMQLERLIIQTIPRQRIETDYYVLEHLRYYKKQIIPQRSIEYVPVVRTIKKIEYIPVQRKIIHYPKQLTDQHLSKITNKSNKQQYLDIVNNSIYGQTTTRAGLQQSNSIKNLNMEYEQQQSSPIKGYLSEQHYVGQKQNEDFIETSILTSLSKAYSPQPTTDHQHLTESYVFDQNIETFDHQNISTSPFISLNRRASNLKEINIKSTQTINNSNIQLLNY